MILTSHQKIVIIYLTLTMHTHDQKEHLRFAVLATDVVLFTLKEGRLHVRLIAVNRPPAYPEGSRGFPGGLIRPDETAEESAVRILEEKSGISARNIYIEQLYTFSAIDRDPRGRVVAVAYIAYVPWESLNETERSDTSARWWSSVDQVSGLAYDHDEIFKIALARLRSRITYTTVINKLMPKEFTLGELERAYEEILQQEQDKRNFRKKIAKLGILAELPKMQTGEPFRPAKLYKFKSSNVKEIEIL